MLATLALTIALSARPEAVVHADEQTAYAEMLTKQAIAADALYAGTPCADAKVEDVATQVVKIKDHPEFAALRERVRVTGCGRNTLQNLSVGRPKGDASPPWKMTATLPGETLTDLAMQRDVLPKAIAAAAADLPATCTTRRMGEVYLTARPGRADFPPPGAAVAKPQAGRPQIRLPKDAEALREKLDVPSAWVEVWPLNLCDHDRTTVVVFLPRRDTHETMTLFIPVWPMIAQHGPGAMPPHAPAS